jgi:hypothetical protein
MSSPGDRLDAHYYQLQSRYQVDYSGAYSVLVTPTGNHSEPIHRWFHFKEAYSHRLLQQVLKDTRLDGEAELRVIDPFSGSGTTVTSALQMVQAGTLERVNAFAVETNPFLHLVSAAKVAAFQADRPEVVRLAGAVAADVLAGRHAAAIVPSLSTFSQREYFSTQAVNCLAALRDAIAARTCGAGDASQLLLQLCLAASIEPASKLRRDGRTLRYVADKQPADAIRTFLNAAERVEADLPRHRLPTSTRAKVLRGDIRDRGLGNVGPFDLCVFSPPYPNNIDYTEVYKIEAWMLGLIDEQAAFSAQRRRTLRSHGSLRWDESYTYLADPNVRAPMTELLDPLLRAIPDDRYKNARTQLVQGYCDDMLQALRRVSAKLRPGAKMACIVGNSLHGHGEASLLVAADLLIARIAELIGFKIDLIDVARTPYRKRTDSLFMRESVIFGTFGGV